MDILPHLTVGVSISNVAQPLRLHFIPESDCHLSGIEPFR
jgi:hypothetical protein